MLMGCAGEPAVAALPLGEGQCSCLEDFERRQGATHSAAESFGHGGSGQYQDVGRFVLHVLPVICRRPPVHRLHVNDLSVNKNSIQENRKD